MTRQAMTAGPERPELDVVEEGRRCGAAEEAEDDGGASVRPAANPLLLPVGWVGMAFGSPNLRATTSCSYVATSRPTCTSAEGETRIRRRPCHHNNIKSYHRAIISHVGASGMARAGARRPRPRRPRGGPGAFEHAPLPFRLTYQIRQHAMAIRMHSLQHVCISSTLN